MRDRSQFSRGASLIEVLVAVGIGTGVVVGGATLMRGFTKGTSKLEGMRAVTEMYKVLQANARNPEVLRMSAMTAPGVPRPGNEALFNCLFPTQPPAAPNPAKCLAGVPITFNMVDLTGVQRTGGAPGTAAAVGFDAKGQRCAGAGCGWSANATFFATCETTLGNASPASCDQALSIAADVALNPNNAVFGQQPVPMPIAERNVTGMRAVEVTRGEVRDRSCLASQRYIGTTDSGEPICENLGAFSCSLAGPNLYLPGFFWGGDGTTPPRPEPNFCYSTNLRNKVCAQGQYATFRGDVLDCHDLRADGTYGIWRDAGTNAAIDASIQGLIQANFASKFVRCPKHKLMVGYDGSGQVLCTAFEMHAEVFNIPYVLTNPVSPVNQVTRVFNIPFKPVSATCSTYTTGHNALSYGVCGCFVASMDTNARTVTVKYQFNSDGPYFPTPACMGTVMASGNNIFP